MKRISLSIPMFEKSDLANAVASISAAGKSAVDVVKTKTPEFKASLSEKAADLKDSFFDGVMSRTESKPGRVLYMFAVEELDQRERNLIDDALLFVHGIPGWAVLIENELEDYDDQVEVLKVYLNRIADAHALIIENTGRQIVEGKGTGGFVATASYYNTVVKNSKEV